MKIELFCNVLADTKTFAEIGRRVRMSKMRFTKSMGEVGVPFTSSLWKCGRATASQRMAYTRAVRRLERMRLIARISEPSRDRTTHVKPTEAAIATLIEYLGEQISLGGLVASLSLTDWGQALARKIEQTSKVDREGGELSVG
ncbi:MAG: hypothetical protein SGI77_16170 [Pirellulaceae bacterium]|nr:hypothetical protein [Pirellulaceae bacterium]